MFRRVVSFPPRMYPVCFQSVGLCLTDEEIIMYLYAAGASLQFASQVVCVCLMANNSLLMLNWIVRGLNAPVRRCAVRDMAGAVKTTVVVSRRLNCSILMNQL
jgi:hypothetical protein